MSHDNQDYRDSGVSPGKHLICLICELVPPGEIYQCKDGHHACKECFLKLEKCPQSGCLFPQLEPNDRIRNTFMEDVAKGLRKVKCCFDECPKQLPKEVMEKHEKECYYNLEKFGDLVNLCQLLGQPDCDFVVNNGNAEEAVKHFVSVHGWSFDTTDNFLMELTGFEDGGKFRKEGNYHYWTPIILDLPEEQCYLLNLAVLVKNESLALLSILLPYRLKVDLSKPPSLQYKLSDGCPNKEDIDVFNFSLTQAAITLSDAGYVLENNISGLHQKSWLESNIIQNGCLLINCEVISERAEEIGDILELETFVCNASVSQRPCEVRTLTSAFDSAVLEDELSALQSSRHPKKYVKKTPNESFIDIFPNSHQIFLADLPDFVEEKDIQDLFLEFGEIVEVKLVMALTKYQFRGTKTLRRIGFVCFEEEKGAQLAVESKDNIFVTGKDGVKNKLFIQPKLSTSRRHSFQ